MKVVIAIDSLKGCLRSAEAGVAAAEGIRRRWPEVDVVCLPVSDGGEGWLEAYGNADCSPFTCISVIVSDPLLRPVRARYLKAGELAVMEVAEACGLHLLRSEERNPLLASSRGVGELLTDAMRHGCRQFIIGLGGSAVSDAGRGMIACMNEYLMNRGEYSPLLERGVECEVMIATDVRNPLCGPNGAAAVFGPQKGATPEMVKELDVRARAFAEENAHRMGFDRSGAPGAGAAGGLGYAFMQFFGAQCRSGAELLLEHLRFDDLIRDADLVITGEGCADSQTLMGKLPAVILRHAQTQHVPCHLLAGAVQDEASLLAAGFATVRSINPPELPLHEAMKPVTARRHLALAAWQCIDISVNENLAGWA